MGLKTGVVWVDVKSYQGTRDGGVGDLTSVLVGEGVSTCDG